MRRRPNAIKWWAIVEVEKVPKTKRKSCFEWRKVSLRERERERILSWPWSWSRGRIYPYMAISFIQLSFWMNGARSLHTYRIVIIIIALIMIYCERVPECSNALMALDCLVRRMHIAYICQCGHIHWYIVVYTVQRSNPFFLMKMSEIRFYMHK